MPVTSVMTDHAARTVAQARGLHQQMHGAGDLLADGDQLHVRSWPCETMTSRRETASRGLLAWTVVSEPS